MKKAERRAVLKKLLAEINAECEQYYENCDEYEEIPDTQILKYHNRILIIYNLDEMKEAAKMLEFEHAAFIRDKIKELSEDV